MAGGFEGKFESADTREPIDIMESVVTKLYPQLVEEKKVGSFIIDVLTAHGCDVAVGFHHLDADRQRAELLGFINDPRNPADFEAIFALESVSPEIKNHYKIE